MSLALSVPDMYIRSIRSHSIGGFYCYVASLSSY